MAEGAATVERHPIRGALWGIPLGLGLMMTLVGQKVISLGTWTPVLIVLLGIVLGVAWAWFAPPKGPKDEATAADEAAESATGPEAGTEA